MDVNLNNRRKKGGIRMDVRRCVEDMMGELMRSLEICYVGPGLTCFSVAMPLKD